MNDESDTPLTPVGDEALEARIVARVLGEASSFEAAELEKLCAADPALRRFERRIRDLHGLIGEDVKAGPDAEWKLPEVKRSKITDLLGVELAEPVAAKRTNRYFARRILLAAAACFMISVIAYSTFSPAAKKEAVPNGVVASLPSTDAAKGAGDRLESLRRAVRQKEEAVAEQRKELSQTIRQEGIIYQGEESLFQGSGGFNEADDAENASKAFLALEQDKIQLESQLQTLLKYDGEELMNYAGGLNLADNAIPTLLPQYQEQKREYEALKSSGLGADHPEVAAKGEVVGKMEEDLVQATENLRETLRAKLEMANEQSARLAARIPGKKDGGIKKGIANQAFVDAKEGYESSQKELKELKEELAAVETTQRGDANTSLASSKPNSPATPGASAVPVQELPQIAKAQQAQAGGVGGAGGGMQADALADAAGVSGAGADSLENKAESFAGRARTQGQMPQAGGGARFGGLKSDLAAITPDTALVPESPAPPADVRLNGLADLAKKQSPAAPAEPGVIAGKEIAGKEIAFRSELKSETALGLNADAPADMETAAANFFGQLKLKAGGGAGDLTVPEQNLSLGGEVRPLQAAPVRPAPPTAFESAVRKDTGGVGIVPLPTTEGGSISLTPLKTEWSGFSGNQPAGKTLQLNPDLTYENKDQVESTRRALDAKPSKSDETNATAQPFSTFSLHVSDASFKLAKAALERGEQPDPASIRPEEFYNAFDYGDPAPGRGEPVACALEQCANPVIPQRNLVRIGVRAGAAGRGQSTPLNLTLLLDSSGSMEREDRRQGMVMAVQQLAGLLKEGDTVSVIGFSRQPRLLVDRLPGTRARELNTLLAQTPSEGGTNLEEGLKLAEELAKRQFNAAAQNRIVLFTDGAANLGDAQPETLQARIETMRQEGIAFDAAGFGTDGLNDKLLERLTRNGNGRYYIVDRPEDADANFAKQLAGAFRPAAENVKVQVRFNPARVGKYKLIGFEEHRLNKEDFRNDAVDAAEMAAEEAGNALYQIEPLPGGEGEIGEVSVRFRDAASGQMVERTWTIPYEAQAPAFDLAPPSIQLAALSAFTAEKLRQAPMAAAIDFQQLGPILAKVKARYPNNQAVSDLGTMIGKLK